MVVMYSSRYLIMVHAVAMHIIEFFTSNSSGLPLHIARSGRCGTGNRESESGTQSSS